MSEPTGHQVHPDPDTLADHAEGLLPSAQAAEVARHLLTCAECRDTRDALAEVRTLLTAYADPGPVPADVAGRIDAALAAAGPVDADADDDDAEPVVAATSTVVPAATPTGRSTRTPFGSKVLQIAAVVVLIAAVGGIAVSAVLSHTRAGDTGGASAGSSAQDAKGAAGSGSSSGGASTGTLRAATGTAYTISNLGPAAKALVAGERQPVSTATSANPSAPSANSGFSTSLPADQRVLSESAAALTTCVRRLTGAAATPLAVDLGTWAGSPATVIVLASPDDPTMLDVFAVRASCPTGSFLGFAHVPR